MSRQSGDNFHKGGHNSNYDAFGEFDKYEPRQSATPNMNHDIQQAKNSASNSENIRLYITIKRSAEIAEEYKKLILMTSVNVKVSLLKRQIEREFSDLFPKEPTFICGKIEDQYGYALSNSSFVYEMMKYGDRLTVYPDDIVNSINNPSTDKDGMPELHTSGDITEIMYLLRNVQQSLCRKLADGDIKGFAQQEELLLNVIPLGFSPSRVIVHNVAVVLAKVFATERLYILEGKDNDKILNLIVTMLNFWIGEHITSDNFLLGHVIGLLEILVKSASFCESFKGAFVISNLMNASNLDFVSSQTKSRIIKIITYLSKGNFANYYNPEKSQQYVPSVLDKKSNNNNHQSRSRLRTPVQNDSFDNDRISSKGTNIKVYDSAYPEKFDPKPSRRMAKNESDSIKTSPLDTMFDPSSKIDLTSGNIRPDNKLYKEYLSLLTLGNAREMHVFAMQNLVLIIDKIVDNIMDSKEDYLQCLNLIEIEYPPQWEGSQIKILDALDKNLNEKRAIDGLQKSVVPRLLKALSYQPPAMHTTLISLLQTHLIKGRYRIDVSTVISIILSPYSRLYDFAIKALSIMSDPSITDNLNYEIQFENHMKLLVELTLSKNKSYEFKNTALKTLANLSLRDSLRPQILYNKGLETLIYHLRSESNLEGQRLSSKALLNLSTSSRDIKLKIITEITEEIRKLHRGELDPIIQGYLQTLINSSR